MFLDTLKLCNRYFEAEAVRQTWAVTNIFISNSQIVTASQEFQTEISELFFLLINVEYFQTRTRTCREVTKVEAFWSQKNV